MGARHRWILAVAVVVVVAAAATLIVVISGSPAATDDEATARVTVAEGGTVRLSDGAPVAIPPGAVDADAEGERLADR